MTGKYAYIGNTCNDYTGGGSGYLDIGWSDTRQ